MTEIYKIIGFVVVWVSIIVLSIKVIFHIHSFLYSKFSLYENIYGILKIPYYWIEVWFANKDIVQRRYDFLIEYYYTKINKKMLLWEISIWIFRKRLSFDY